MTAAGDSTIFLFGGVHLVMWWNFVARTPEEGAEQLMGVGQRRFGTVNG